MRTCRLLERVRALLIGGAVFLVSSCGITGPDLDTEGVVHYTGIDNCWVILVEETSYHPLRLEEEFRDEGLRVRFRANLRDDLTAPCAVGPIIELTHIERAAG